MRHSPRHVPVSMMGVLRTPVNAIRYLDKHNGALPNYKQTSSMKCEGGYKDFDELRAELHKLAQREHQEEQMRIIKFRDVHTDNLSKVSYDRHNALLELERRLRIRLAWYKLARKDGDVVEKGDPAVVDPSHKSAAPSIVVDPVACEKGTPHFEFGPSRYVVTDSSGIVGFGAVSKSGFDLFSSRSPIPEGADTVTIWYEPTKYTVTEGGKVVDSGIAPRSVVVTREEYLAVGTIESGVRTDRETGKDFSMMDAVRRWEKESAQEEVDDWQAEMDLGKLTRFSL